MPYLPESMLGLAKSKEPRCYMLDMYLLYLENFQIHCIWPVSEVDGLYLKVGRTRAIGLRSLRPLKALLF
jgi:hypothetical protein